MLVTTTTLYIILLEFQAKTKIGQAKTSASESKKMVDKALQDVEKISKELLDLADSGK